MAVLIASGTGLFGRLITLGELPLVWFRVIIGAAVLAAILHLRNIRREVHNQSAEPNNQTAESHHSRMPLLWSCLGLRIMGCGVLLSIHWVFFYGSIKAANVSVGAVCFALVGFFTAVLEPLICRHRSDWRELLLGALTVAGIALIFGFDARYRLGIAMGVVSSVLYALFSIYSKQVQASSNQPSSTMLLYELVGGAAVLTLLMPLYASIFSDTILWPVGNDLWLLLVFASVFTVLPFLLQLQALRHISAFTVNLTYNLEPVYTIILASLLFGEAQEVGASFWVGVMMIALSVVLQTMRSARKKEKNLP